MQDVATRRARGKAAVGVGSLLTRMSREAMDAELKRTGRRDLAAKVSAYKAASEAMNLALDLAIAYSNGPGYGPWPSFEQAAEVEGLPSMRTFYRRLGTYRQIFGPDADPYELAERIYRDFAGRLKDEGPAVGADLPASILPAA